MSVVSDCKSNEIEWEIQKEKLIENKLKFGI